MVCGGFVCFKNVLCVFNVVYMVRFWRWGKFRVERLVGRIFRGFLVGRRVFWGFWEDFWEFLVKREFLGIFVGRGEIFGD